MKEEATPNLFLICTDLENAHLMLSSLAESACLAIEDGNTIDHYSAGLMELFRHALSSLQQSIDYLRPPIAPHAEKRELEVKSMRDRFIADAYREGRSPAEISMALNLKQDAVLRAINRLKGDASHPQAQAG